MNNNDTMIRGGGMTFAGTTTIQNVQSRQSGSNVQRPMGALPPCLDDVIVVDVETSGLDSRRHGVLEIGAVRIWDGEEFEGKCWLDADRGWEQGALDVNGYREGNLYRPETAATAETAAALRAD